MHAGIPSCYIDKVPKLQEMAILVELQVVMVYLSTWNLRPHQEQQQNSEVNIKKWLRRPKDSNEPYCITSWRKTTARGTQGHPISTHRQYMKEGHPHTMRKKIRSGSLPSLYTITPWNKIQTIRSWCLTRTQNITKRPRNDGRSTVTRLWFHVDKYAVTTCILTNIAMFCNLGTLSM